MATEGGNRVRASDAEREEYAKMLRAAMTEGRLTLEEGEERLSKVYEARFRDELPGLTTDLPDGGRRALFDTPEAREEFQRQARRYFAGRTGFVLVVAALLVGLWALSGAHFFWPAIPLFFLVFALVKTARWRRWARGGWGGPPWAGGCGVPRGRAPWGGEGPWSAHSDSQSSGWRR